MPNHELHHGAIPGYSKKANFYAGVRVTNLDDRDYSTGFKTTPRPAAKVVKPKKTTHKTINRKLSPRQVVYRKRIAAVQSILSDNHAVIKPISKNKVSGYTTLVDIINKLTATGLDIVSVFSRAERYGKGGRETSLWVIDRFHRISVKPDSLMRASTKERNDIIRKILLDGYLVQVTDFDLSSHSVLNVIKALKQEGLDVCAVKCKSTSEEVRGYLVPSTKNNLTKKTIKNAL